MHQLKEHYERQDTGQLLELVQQDITDEARAVLGDVLARRGIAQSTVAAARETARKQEAARLEVEQRMASRWARLAAFLIDMVGSLPVIMIVLLPLDRVSAGLYDTAAICVWLAYLLLKDGIPRQSFGKRIFGLCVIQADYERPCNWAKSLLRNLTHMFFVFDALFILGQRRKRLGDMISGTLVVKRA